MRHHLGSEHRLYSFSRRHEPVLTVAPGDEVLLQTRDCFDDVVPHVPDPASLAHNVSGYGNPATGPVAISGAEPGMTLRVDILEVSCAPRGLIYATDRRTGMVELHVPEIDADNARFSDDLTFPLDPMIGVIGVAPATGEVPNTTPGRHGGNMDSIEIKPGAVVYLPITVPGALFGAGDVHALQADGEVCGMGIEVASEVLVRLSLLPRIVSPWPLVEWPDHVAVLTAALTLDEAADLAVAAARDLLVEQLGVSDAEGLMLQSMLCDLRVNQIVDPLKGMRVSIPRTLLKQLRF
jgi:amidase